MIVPDHMHAKVQAASAACASSVSCTLNAAVKASSTVFEYTATPASGGSRAQAAPATIHGSMCHGGGSKTFDEMFDPLHQGVARRTLAALAPIGRSVAPSLAHGKLVRAESMETRECSEVGLAWAAAIRVCEENRQEFAG